MAVTIQQIETKEFKVIPQGYDPEEVDLFLDDIVDEMERLQKELKTLRADMARTTRPAPVAASSTNKVSDDTIKNMLVNAQRVCDETISDAKKRAEDLLGNARHEAESVVRDAREESHRLDSEREALVRALEDYKTRFRKLVDEQMRILDAR